MISEKLENVPNSLIACYNSKRLLKGTAYSVEHLTILLALWFWHQLLTCIFGVMHRPLIKQARLLSDGLRRQRSARTHLTMQEPKYL